MDFLRRISFSFSSRPQDNFASLKLEGRTFSVTYTDSPSLQLCVVHFKSPEEADTSDSLPEVLDKTDSPAIVHLQQASELPPHTGRFLEEEGQLVWYKEMVPRPLGPKWRGPARVCKRFGPVSFEVQHLESGQVLRAHLNHLRPYHPPEELAYPDHEEPRDLEEVLIAELFNHWGLDGFLQHVKDVRQFYQGKRDAILLAAEKHLTGLCEWNVPQGGMFLWIKVLGVKDTEDMLLERGAARHVLLVPGKGFTTKFHSPCQYMRASYSTVTAEQMDKAFRILAEVIREEMQQP
ncbi:hypothetical protein C7M84_016696 [Penaeus vannamei]|uniref:Aminotransferase class I/classII domain-containing protein n=1 Tax=Penaeus vannamei TaxID=6689 RepID=A0A3R7SL18_PENVA|nr:hypothetical protein C7M84_016696 [Penaeus vannamei]